MKILLAHVCYRQKGGEDVVFENELSILQKAGVAVVPLQIYNNTIKDESISGRIKVGASTLWSRSGYRIVSDMLSRVKPDVVHFHNTFPLLSPSVYWACSNSGVPVIQTLHNYRLICAGALLYFNNNVCERCVGKYPFPALVQCCYRDSLLATTAVTAMQVIHRFLGTFRNKVDRYFALTEFAKSRMVLGGVPEDLITVKPNFLPDPPKPSYKPGNYALFVGRLSREKGIVTLLKAWAGVENLPLWVAGDGPVMSELLSNDLVQKERVRLLGYQSKEKIRQLMQESAFIVIPSEWYEGFPMVVLESFAAGKPVLCSRIGSLNELINEGVTGCKFDPGDAKDLAGVVINAMGKAGLLAEMGKAARLEFEHKYSADVARDLLLREYEQVIAKSNRKK
ncbi:MAG: glycosyltransferase family 4 protein [Proteobacteria bacterium]|nr:glycosyltransferase family 4 protein [Pseudomonadota bacterium]